MKAIVLFTMFILMQSVLTSDKLLEEEKKEDLDSSLDELKKEDEGNKESVQDEKGEDKNKDEASNTNQEGQNSTQVNETQTAQNQTNTNVKGSQIKNFTDFPIKIGTYDTSFDVYRAGQINEAYKKVPNARVIPENEDAEIFYISVLKEHYNGTLQLKYPEVIYEKENVIVTLDIPRIKDTSFKRPLDILLVFECQQKSSSFVTLLLDFKYGDVDQTIPINFIKECGKPRVIPQTTTTFFGDLFYYSFCCLGIFIGFYLTKLFKNSLMKDHSISSFGLDTSYKRKYDKMTELPDRTNDIQNQL